jgi:hypothetical protein
MSCFRSIRIVPIASIFAIAALFSPARMSADEVATAWHARETGFFTIVYRGADAAQASEVAGFADARFEEVAAFFGFRPSGRIICVLRSDTDFANGSFVPIPPHINLITSAPSGPWLGASTESWLDTVFVHELIHYFQFAAEGGLFGFASKLFGPSVAAASAGFTPGWLIEGPAVFGETLITGGGRGDSQYYRMFARAHVLEGTFPALALAAHSSRFPPSGRIYLAGYLALDAVVERYGIEAFREVIAKFLDFPLLGPWRAIRTVTGDQMKTIYTLMLSELFARYRAEALDMAADDRIGVTEHSPVITPDTIGNYHLPVPTDSGWIMYRTRPDRSPAIVRFDPDTGAEEPLLDASLSDPFSLSADRSLTRVAFASPVVELGGGEITERSELYLFSPSTGETRRVSYGGHLRHPALTPDGSALYAIRQEGSFASLVEVDPESGALSLVLRTAETNLYTPIVTADGARIVLVANTRGRQEIVSIATSVPRAAYDPPTGFEEGEPWNVAELRRITETSEVAEYYPREEDGLLYFGSDGTYALEIHSIDLETLARRVLLRDPVGAFAAVPDGESLVFATYTSNGFALKRAARPTGAPVESPTPEKPAAAESRRPNPEPSDHLGRRYTDLPRLAFWYPLPWVTDPFGGTSIEWGPQATIFARSPVHGHELAVQAGLLPLSLQPSLSAELILRPRSQTLRFILRHGYREYLTTGTQTDEITVEQIVPLFVHSRYPLSRSISAGWSARYRYELEGDAPFRPFAPQTDASHDLLLSLLFGMRLSRLGSSLHASAPVSFSLGLRSDLTAIGSAEPAPPLRFRHESTLTLPFGASNHLVSVGFSGGVRNSGLLPGAVPAGGFLPETSAGTVDLLATLRYLTPVVPLDVAIPFGFHLGAIRGAMFVQGYGSVLPSPALDRNLYVGTEVGIEFGRGVDIPLTIGVSARIPTVDPSSFDPASDIRFYGDFGDLIGLITER